MEGRAFSNHKRSSSDSVKKKARTHKLNNTIEASCQPSMEIRQPERIAESKKWQSNYFDLQSSSNQEIMQLQKRLQEQFVERRALEKAYYSPLAHDDIVEDSIPKGAMELIKEISVLELEVVYLEQYLLSLYRKRFDQHMMSLHNKDAKEVSVPGKDNVYGDEMPPKKSAENPAKEFTDQKEMDELLDSSVHRSHSTLSHRSGCLNGDSQMKTLSRAVDSFHSLPLSMLEKARSASSKTASVSENLGGCFSDDVPETPNWLSEEMIKCISTIYYELADLSSVSQDSTLSSISYSSSVLDSSSLGQGNSWGSQSHCKKLSSFDYNPFHIKGSEEFLQPYSSMVEVLHLCRDSEKLKEVEYMLRKFRSLVHRLEGVDPRNMKREEKLAFWINVHNSLVMHALIVYGVPVNNSKRMSLVLKAAYNIGGHTVNVDMIQIFMLGCRLPRPGQWLRMLFSSMTKYKFRDARKAYAIHHPEPLLHFALCSGSHSDPAVRIYTPKRIFEELETAREEYIQSTFSVLSKEQKILLPKIVESFAKDTGLPLPDVMEIIKCHIPDSQRKIIEKCQLKKSWKGIEWIPHDFAFRFLLSKELA